MTTNYGRATTGGNDTWVSNQGTNNQYAYAVGGVPAGVVTALDVYMAGGSGGTCRTILCLWDNTGALLAQTAQFTAAAGGGGVNAQAWQRATLTSPIVVPANSYYIGFWRNPADAAEWSYASGAGTIHPQAPGGGAANVASPGALSGVNGATTGAMSAYLEWQPSGGYDYNGTSYQQTPAYGYNGSAWVLMQGVYSYNGSAWVLVN